jgi:hypothetical protein
MLFRRLLRNPGVLLLLLLFGIYAYFYQGGGSNQNTRFDLVRSIVEEGTVQIDHYHENTIDKAKRGDHYYTDKAPGVSWLAVPVYAVTYTAAGSGKQYQRFLDVAMYLVTLMSVALPSAISGSMLYVLGRIFGLAKKASVALSLSYGLGTLAFPYSTLFYGHQLAAALLLAAFALLVRTRHAVVEPPTPRMLAAIGFLLGYAVVTEYPAVLASAVLLVYAALFIRPFIRLGWLLAGMSIPGMALAWYQNTAFGGPFVLPYEFSTQVHRHLGYYMGISLPDAHVLYQILFSSYRGLFHSAPWLLMAIPGAALLLRQRQFRSEGIVCIIIVVLFIWLNASLVDWEGGWTMGPRYLIPAIPFLASLAIGFWSLLTKEPVIATSIAAYQKLRIFVMRWLRLSLRVVCFSAVGLSIIGMLASTAVTPEVPVGIRKPFEEFLFPLLISGHLAFNLQPVNAPAESLARLLEVPTKFMSSTHGNFVFLANTGETITLPSYAQNLGQLVGLDGMLSLLPLALYVLILGSWLGHVCNTRAEDG